MNISDLVFCMKCGEEIEFYINGNCYFIQPDYERANSAGDTKKMSYPFMVLYDATDYDDPKILLIGTAENLIDYVFDGEYTLRNNFDKFKFLW